MSFHNLDNIIIFHNKLKCMLFAIQGIFYVAEIGFEVRIEGHQHNTNNIHEVRKKAIGYFIPLTLNCLKSS